MTVPTFTPTPVITAQTAADMPASIGSQIGATTDANFDKTKAWSSGLEGELKVVKFTPTTAFVAPAANYTISSATVYMVRGKMVTLLFSATRTNGAAALVSAANGQITSVTVATLVAGYRPTYFPMFWGRTSLGPMVSFYISTSGAIVLRGCTVPSYTFTTGSYSVDFEARWITP